MSDAATRVFAILGHPVRHSLSPRMHNEAFHHLGLNAIYVAFDVTAEEFSTALNGAAALGFGGLNITIPHKQAAFHLLERRDSSAELTGAVNTICFGEDGPKGYNTDMPGFLAALEEAFGAGPRDRKVFLLGAGGAGRAVAFACATAGASMLTICDIDTSRARHLAREVGEKTGHPAVLSVQPQEKNTAVREADLVVNATPVGMHKDDVSPIESQLFREQQWVYDVIYVKPVTPFMQAAAAAGALTANGLGMLLHQGAEAFRLWTGREPPIPIMRRALEAAVYGNDGAERSG